MAKELNSSPRAHIIFSPSINKQRNDLISYFVKVLSEITGGKKYNTFYSYGNTLGVNNILDQIVPGRASYPDILKKIGPGEVRLLLMLGEEFSVGDTAKVDLVIQSSHFSTGHSNEKRITLPLASHLEESGSFVFATGGRKNTRR